ncbi:MAG: hypothetical protein IPJ20_19310 [Flammeovirgaceae bacterium]|nr:hypothetical protein [Flammeovirgaceae bacterium]
MALYYIFECALPLGKDPAKVSNAEPESALILKIQWIPGVRSVKVVKSTLYFGQFRLQYGELFTPKPYPDTENSGSNTENSIRL